MPRNELNVLYPRAFPLGAVPRGLRTRIPPAAPRTLFDIERPVTSFRLLLAAGLSFTLMTGPSPALPAATPRLDAAYQVAAADTQTAGKRTTTQKKSSARKSTSAAKAPVRKSLQTEKEKSKAESEKPARKRPTGLCRKPTRPSRKPTADCATSKPNDAPWSASCKT